MGIIANSFCFFYIFLKKRFEPKRKISLNMWHIWAIRVITKTGLTAASKATGMCDITAHMQSSQPGSSALSGIWRINDSSSSGKRALPLPSAYRSVHMQACCDVSGRWRPARESIIREVELNHILVRFTVKSTTEFLLAVSLPALENK